MKADRKCDHCPSFAVRARVVRDRKGKPDHAEFVCQAHAAPRGGVPWGDVAHADAWELSDAKDEAEELPGPCVACGVQCDEDGICPCCRQAEKIDDALVAFDDNDDETKLVDLVTAAMHFAHRERLSFPVVLAVARAHFNAERKGGDAEWSAEDAAAIDLARAEEAVAAEADEVEAKQARRAEVKP